MGDNIFLDVDYRSGCYKSDVEVFSLEALNSGNTILALYCNLAKLSADSAPGITNRTFKGRG